MSGIAYQNIGVFADHLLPNFLERLAKKKIETDFTFQSYPMVEWMFRNHTLKLRGGQSLEFRSQRGTSGQAIKMRPYQPIPRNYANRVSKGSAPWGAIAKSAAWNERLANHFTEGEKLTEYMDNQFLDCLKGTLDRLETSTFEVPESSADDMPFMGIPYLLPKLGVGVEDPVGGFNGQTAVLGDASTTTVIQGTDRSIVTQARTFVATHNGVNSAYLDTLRRCQNRTNYKPPRELKQYAETEAGDFRYLTNQLDAEMYESLVNKGPDDRNGDANPFYGVLTYRGMMWMPVPALDGKADSPGYGWNFKKLFPFAHQKYWMKWSEAIREPNDDESYYKRIDCEYQFACINEQQAGWCMHSVRAA
mgnify:CR=1 FL=1